MASNGSLSPKLQLDNYVIGFTKGMVDLSYTKRKQSNVAEKSTPKSIDGDLKQKMPLSKLNEVRLMRTS